MASKNNILIIIKQRTTTKRRSISLLFLLFCPVIYGYNSGIEQAIINSNLEALIQEFADRKLSEQDKQRYAELADQIIQFRLETIKANVFPKEGPLPPHLQQKCTSIWPILAMITSGASSAFFLTIASFERHDEIPKRVATLSVLCLAPSIIWNAAINSGTRWAVELYKEFLEQQYNDALRIKQRIYDA